MRRAISMHQDTDVIFFLGDGLSDIEEIRRDYPQIAFFAVRGNCDLRSTLMGNDVPKTDSMRLLGKNIVFTHGDLYGAKYGTEELKKLARELGADIVLFGHTHSPYSSYIPAAEEKMAGQECPAEKAFYLFNPGSISDRGSFSPPSYGIIILTESEPLFSHGSIKIY